MKKGDKIEFQANNITITGIVMYIIDNQIHGNSMQTTYLVYSQNRLITVLEDEINECYQINEDEFEQCIETNYYLMDIVCDYCVIPEYDCLI